MSQIRKIPTNPASKPDFVFNNHGSVCLLTPMTDEAKRWVIDHLPEDRTYFGASVAIEPRCANAILEGIVNAGLLLR